MIKLVAVILVLALAVVIYALLGLALSWVLTFFGLQVPWFPCAVLFWLLSLMFHRSSK